MPATGTCYCFKGYIGEACELCDNNFQSYYDGGPCIKVPEPTCHDNVKNGLEFGVDCGQLAGCKRCGANEMELPRVSVAMCVDVMK